MIPTPTAANDSFLNRVCMQAPIYVWSGQSRTRRSPALLEDVSGIGLRPRQRFWGRHPLDRVQDQRPVLRIRPRGLAMADLREEHRAVLRGFYPRAEVAVLPVLSQIPDRIR